MSVKNCDGGSGLEGLEEVERLMVVLKVWIGRREVLVATLRNVATRKSFLRTLTDGFQPGLRAGR
jgi:hypothetical protein